MLDGFGDSLDSVFGRHSSLVGVFDIDHEVFEIVGEGGFVVDVADCAEPLIDLPLTGLVGGGTGDGGSVIEIEERIGGDFEPRVVGADEIGLGGCPDVAATPCGGIEG